MNVNEYGIVFRFGTGYDMSGFATLTLVFTKPDNSVLTVTNSSTPNAVTLGVVPVTTTEGVFAANQYVNYTFAVGDVNEQGIWAVWLTYVDSTKRLISDVALFTINP